MKPKRMVLMHIPNRKCNFKCKYCYLSQVNEWINPPEEFHYSVEHIAKCLSSDRLGGVCLINLTGDGETMLQPQIVDLCKLLLQEGHFIEFVTNCTVSKVVDDFLYLPDELLKRLEFKISFHYRELQERKMTEKFWDNVEKIQKSVCSFTLELMPYDEIIKDIDKIINDCEENAGAKCHLTVGRADYFSSRQLLTDLPKEEYIEKWSVFSSEMFELKMKLLGVKRKEFCYAGDWTIYVNLYTGETAPCYAQAVDQNIFEDPSKPIKFRAVGHHCREPYCINGHAHISLGVIPEYDSPRYVDVRNRIRKDGTEWFNPECKDFFGSKLYESNQEYGVLKRFGNTVSWYFLFPFSILKDSQRIKKKIKKLLEQRNITHKKLD